MTKHIAVYARVSSKQQDTKSQIPELTRWANAQELPIEWHEDKVTGTKMDRPAWNKLEHAIRSGKVATVS